MLVKGLVFSRDEGLLHRVRNRFDRNEEPSLPREFRHHGPVTSMNPGGHRRLVLSE